MEHVKLNEIQVVKNSKGEYKVRIKDMEKEGIRPKSFWYGARYDASSHGTKLLKNIIPTNNFSFPKSIFTVKDCIKLTCEEDSYILDFFAGSGTTGHATLQINAEDGGNRKFILVEMGNYFEDILKQRIQKVIYTENWCDGKPIDNEGYRKQIIKYHTLEQYEDSLENIEFTQKPKLKSEISDYLVRYSINFESKDTPILINFDTIKNPFNYQIKILTETGAKLVKVDLIETFNYLHAIEVKSIKFKEYENRFYQFIIGIRKNKQILVVWRDYSDSVDGKTGKHSKFDPVRDREIIQTEIINKNGKGIMEFDEIYVNGNCLVENFIPIESIFKKHFNSKNEGW